jgi:5-oxopent-3-ene-1,2,5-tricarboxylate decarboxylase/2-hydroxyhepta-2,4-diene-1,7-dioate isomerase
MKTVVGTFLNFQGAWKAMEPLMHKEPHFKPPEHVVLYVKPANTWRKSGDAIVLPHGVDEVEVGATLGIVMGTATSRVHERDALKYVAGYVAVNDVTVPHPSVLRPPIKQKCRDSFCPIGEMKAADEVLNPNDLAIRIWVNGELKATHSTRQLLRPISRLIADVTEFMTLEAGDLLLVGTPENLPRARANDRVAVEIEGIGRVENNICVEGDRS